MDFRDRRPVLALFGSALLLVGILAAFLGPVEIYCFYLFSEGGRFYYEGFGFGSFMFGHIASQILGYYVIAAVFIPLGYGHLRVRRWARTLGVTLFWFWLVLGLPLMIVFLGTLFSAKDLPPAVALGVVVALALSYPLVPVLLIRFYQGHNVRWTFDTRDPDPCWIEGLPQPILVLSSLFVFYAIVLHVPIFFNGLFPCLGVWLTGLQGIIALDIAIMGFVGLTWGTLTQRGWAWWGALLWVGLLTLTSIGTFLASSYQEILAAMSLPPFEMGILQGVPLEGGHLAAFVGIPLVVTLVVLLFSKRHFGAHRQTAPHAQTAEGQVP
jgi:hypothetical protein